MYKKLIFIPMLFSITFAEAIEHDSIQYFQTTPFIPFASAPPASETTPSQSTNAPTTSITLTLDSRGLWTAPANAIFSRKISDHTLEGQMVDSTIPVYTWNMWGFQSKGGFSSTNNETAAQYKNGRLKEQIDVLYQLFSKSPEAIVCLQEVHQTSLNARLEILNSLSALNVSAEYLTQTNSAPFGQVILYRKDRYKPVKAYKPSTPDNYSSGAAGRFISTADARQTNRVLKVYFEELTGKQRQIAVVNVHLAYQSPNLPNLLDELIAYSQGKAPKTLAVIAGDFNHTINSYTPPNSTVTVKQVGKSVVFSNGASKTKQTQDNVDGIITVQP